MRGSIAAALRQRPAARLSFALARDDIDDAAHGVGAVERRLRAAQNLDALDVRHDESAEIHRTVR
jgi:hypothetical protein